MKSTPLYRLLTLVLALTALGANAEKADRDKPMNIEADALRYDDVKQVGVYTGRVVVTKGTIVIRGAVLTVRQDADGSQHGLVTGEPGKQAFFRQKREGLDEYIEGEGDTIEYDGRAQTVRLIKQAQLRRYRGATLSDEMSGAVIVYNNATDMFAIDGSSPRVPAGAPGSAGTGRVRATLAPKASAPQSLSGPGAVLKATPALGGDAR